MYKQYYYLLALFCLLLLSPLKRCSRLVVNEPELPESAMPIVMPEEPAPVADAPAVTSAEPEPVHEPVIAHVPTLAPAPAHAIPTIPEPKRDVAPAEPKKAARAQRVRPAVVVEQPTEESEVIAEQVEFAMPDALVPRQAPATPVAPTRKQMTVVVDIPEAIRSYKHFFGTYKPTTFRLNVNGTPSAPEETITIDATDTLVISYYAQFENGRESSKEYTFSINPETDKTTITFNWKQKNRVELDEQSAPSLISVKDLL